MKWIKQLKCWLKYGHVYQLMNATTERENGHNLIVYTWECRNCQHGRVKYL